MTSEPRGARLPVLAAALLLASCAQPVMAGIWSRSAKDGEGAARVRSATSVTLIVDGMMKSRSGAT